MATKENEQNEHQGEQEGSQNKVCETCDGTGQIWTGAGGLDSYCWEPDMAPCRDCNPEHPEHPDNPDNTESPDNQHLTDCGAIDCNDCYCGPVCCACRPNEPHLDDDDDDDDDDDWSTAGPYPEWCLDCLPGEGTPRCGHY